MFLVATPLFASLAFGFILFGILDLALDVEKTPGFLKLAAGLVCGYGWYYFMPDMLLFMQQLRRL